MIEDMGDGQSVIDHGRDVVGHEMMTGINPSGSAPAQIHGEVLCGNMRAAMYVRAAMLVNRGLVDVPEDPELREEILTMELRFDRLRKSQTNTSPSASSSTRNGSGTVG